MNDIIIIWASFMVILFFIVLFYELDKETLTIETEIKSENEYINLFFYLKYIKISGKFYLKIPLFSELSEKFLYEKFPFLTSKEIDECFGNFNPPDYIKMISADGVFRINRENLNKIGKFIKNLKDYFNEGYRKCKKLNDERKKIAFKE